MATRQSLKGGTDKIYEIINTFNRGYNTSVADDQLSENIFRDITNFLPSTEGNITKRPGIHRTHMYDLFKELRTFSDENFVLTVRGNTNRPGMPSNNFNYLYTNLFEMAESVTSRIDTIGGVSKGVTGKFTPQNLANFTILEDKNILDYISDCRELLDFTKSGEIYEKGANLDFIAIFYGPYVENYQDGSVVKELIKANGISIIKVGIELSKGSDGKYNMRINYEIRLPYRSAYDKRLTFRYEADPIIDFAIYADKYYFMNGYDAIVKIERKINPSYSEDSILETYKDSSKLYKPTAIELTNIGFNILASNPLEFYDIQGSANAIRGVFYTYNGEPTQVIPYNKSFKINILQSGSGDVSKPKYRPDNGEIDEAKNPYKDMTGSFNTGKTIFTCDGLNTSSKIEIKITKGDTEFLTYATLGSVELSSIGKIADIDDLILSSRYCKVINNQLVLFGNHGYMFFSEYDNFNYFPNYNNIYAAETENEEVVSINYFRQYYAIFTNKRIKRMTGAFGTADFGVYPLNDFIGCINPKSIRQIQNYIYFLSYNGIYILKQGYLGEGTENVEQIDLPIYNSYEHDNMLKGYTIQNYYALYSRKDAILYNFVNDAFYKLETSDVNEDEVGELEVNETRYSIPFQYNKLQDALIYGVRINNKNVDPYGRVDYNIIFDLCLQTFSDEETDRTDNELTFVSTLETAAMSLGTPTNTKKFKEIYMKLYNSYGKSIPLYVTIKVDDKVVVSPTNYEIRYDEETFTYYYILKTDSNKTLKGYNVLGTLELGIDPLGERTMQILKMRVSSKGRAIKVIISDGITQGNDGYSPKQNRYRFDVATLGIVYKLKKVKEG